MDSKIHSIRSNEDSICCFRPISSGGVRILWELTSRCNLSCLHCFRIIQDRDNELNTERCVEILDELLEINTKKVMFVGGEPVIRKDLELLIFEAHRRGMLVDLNTNAELIDDAKAIALRSAGLEEATVSLDGATAERHDKQRNRPGSFNRVLQGIESLRKAGIAIDLSFVPTKINESEVTLVIDLAKELSVTSLTFAGLVIDGAAIENQNELSLTPESRRSVMERIKEKRKELNGRFPIRTSRLCETVPLDTCWAGQTVGAIDAGGYLHPCALYWIDRTSANSLHERTVLEIWHNPVFKNVRKITETPADCPHSCPHFHNCRGGCRGVAKIEKGSHMFPDPLCELVNGTNSPIYVSNAHIIIDRSTSAPEPTADSVLSSRSKKVDNVRKRLLDPETATKYLQNHDAARSAINQYVGSSYWAVVKAVEVLGGVSNLKIKYSISSSNNDSIFTYILKRYFDFYVYEPAMDFGTALTRRVEREAAALTLLSGLSGRLRVPVLLTTNPEDNWNLMEFIEDSERVQSLKSQQANVLGIELASFQHLKGFPQHLTSSELVKDMIDYHLRLGRFDLLPVPAQLILKEGLFSKGSIQRRFIHGNISTKNLLISSDGRTLYLLDFEQANESVPESELGFLMADILIAQFRTEVKENFLASVDVLHSLSSGYEAGLQRAFYPSEEKRIVFHLIEACLYRSRTLHFLDGSFQNNASKQLRTMSRDLLESHCFSLIELFKFLERNQYI